MGLMPYHRYQPPCRGQAGGLRGASVVAAMTVNLLDLDLEGLAAFCERLGEKRFRAVQLFRWIHQRGARDFSAMTDLARSLREKLPGHARIKV